MYTGIYKARGRRRGYLPIILLLGGLTAACVMLVGSVIGAFRDLLASDTVIFGPAAEPPTTQYRDTEPPEILGVQNIVLYQGDTAAYRSGITVTDNDDPSPSLEVDSSRVDLTVPGSYGLIYTATDASGNAASAEATVTVLLKKEGFVGLETVSDSAQTLLNEILQPGASPREQVNAIYAWARANISYGGHSDRTDWRQTGYRVIQELRGDCFGYYAVCKLLFEQLGIPNVDVVKVKNSEEDSEHFWSLVSIDGGENYYHFDVTPRVGEGDSFCMVTDAFLDAYSENHKNSHNRDKSLYPATPKEDLP